MRIRETSRLKYHFDFDAFILFYIIDGCHPIFTALIISDKKDINTFLKNLVEKVFAKNNS